MSTVNLSTSDPPALARRYAALLGMEIKVSEPGVDETGDNPAAGG